jgi:hypothetical protein
MICTHCALPTTEYDFLTAVDGSRVWIHGHCMTKAGLRVIKTGRLDDLRRPDGTRPAPTEAGATT